MLQSLVKEKRYRLAMKDCLDVMMILEQHSEGFESLKSIEDSCRKILREMVGELRSQGWGRVGRDHRGRNCFRLDSKRMQSTLIGELLKFNVNQVKNQY